MQLARKESDSSSTTGAPQYISGLAIVSAPLILVSLAIALVATQKLEKKQSLDQSHYVFNLDWELAMTKLANKYYEVAYKLENTTVYRTVDGVHYTVHRPDHGILHGIRQGLHAVDFAWQMVKHYPETVEAKFIVKEFKRDPNLFKKMFVASLFQRTGRENEQSMAFEFAVSAKEKFEYEAKKFIGTLFESGEEVVEYGDSIIAKFKEAKSMKISEKANIIGSFLLAGHKSDLRRIEGFDKDVILKGIQDKFKGSLPNSKEKMEDKIVPAMWVLSGQYLLVCGDYDIDPQPDRQREDRFFVISNDPAQAVEKINGVRSQFWPEH